MRMRPMEPKVLLVPLVPQGSVQTGQPVQRERLLPTGLLGQRVQREQLLPMGLLGQREKLLPTGQLGQRAPTGRSDLPASVQLNLSEQVVWAQLGLRRESVPQSLNPERLFHHLEWGQRWLELPAQEESWLELPALGPSELPALGQSEPPAPWGLQALAQLGPSLGLAPLSQSRVPRSLHRAREQGSWAFLEGKTEL